MNENNRKHDQRILPIFSISTKNVEMKSSFSDFIPYVQCYKIILSEKKDITLYISTSRTVYYMYYYLIKTDQNKTKNKGQECLKIY